MSSKSGMKTYSKNTKKSGKKSVPDKASDLFDQLFAGSDKGNVASSSLYVAAASSPPAVSPAGSDQSLGSPPSQVNDTAANNKRSSKADNRDTDSGSGSGGDELPVTLQGNESTGLSQDFNDVGLDSPPPQCSSDSFSFLKPALPARQSPKRAATAADSNAEKRKKQSPPSPQKANIPAASYKHQWDREDAFDGDVDEQDEAEPEPVRKNRRPIYASLIRDDDSCSSKHNQLQNSKPTELKIRQVKDAHQCHEVGAVQSYTEDVEYLLETLSPKTKTDLRYLSLLNLTKKCVQPEFRQFLRSHGYIQKLFHTLDDAYRHHNLSLLCACVFYLLSRTRTSLPLDERCVLLLVRLFTGQGASATPVTPQCVTQVWTLLSQWSVSMHAQVASASSCMEEEEEPSQKQQPISFQFDVTKHNLSSSFLACESLVYISAVKGEPWFKKCMRSYGALEHIVQQVSLITGKIPLDALEWTEAESMQPTKWLERHLRILESVTLLAEDNRTFLIAHRGSALLKQCARLLRVCHDLVQDRATHADDTQLTKYTALLKLVIRVLCNLSNNNELCCERVGSLDGFLQTCLSCVSHVVRVCVPVHERFDILVLLLGFVCNIVEHSNTNRQRLINLRVAWTDNELTSSTKKTSNGKHLEQLPALAVLAKMFVLHDAAAVRMDEEVDEEIDMDRMGTPSPDESDNDDEQVQTTSAATAKGKKEQRPVTERDVQQVLQSVMSKAGAHMEDCMSASYIALLCGCLLQQNEDHVDVVREQVPNRSLQPMLDRLTQFKEFMEITSKVGENSLEGINKVIALLTSLQAIE